MREAPAREGPLPCDACACCGRPTRSMTSICGWRPAIRRGAGADEVLVEVRAAGVNRSDVSAAMGRMPQAVWPRTPGREWAGVVVEGPAELIGREVFGAGGDLGITRDGTHASHLVLSREALVERAGDADTGGSRRARRAVRHRAGRIPSRRHAEAGRCGAGDGGQRQGRPGSGADRGNAWRARVRRDASQRNHSSNRTVRCG